MKARDSEESGGYANLIKEMWYDYKTGGRAIVQEFPGGKRTSKTARELCFWGQSID